MAAVCLGAGLFAAARVQGPAHSDGATNGPPARWMGRDGKPLPFHNDDEVLEFLRTAKLMAKENIPRGVTRPRVVELEKDGVRARAHFTVIDETKKTAPLSNGKQEFNFRDCHRFNGAAYELARMLGLDNVPPATSRFLLGERGTLSLWVEGAFMERERQERKQEPPDSVRWNQQFSVMHVFDNLIYNTDRTQENILIDAEWKVWMIDHTRAFRQWVELPAPATVNQIERGMWEKLQQLDKKEASKRLRPYLSTFDIDAVFKRRDLLVELIRKRIATRGEQNVLFSWN